MADNDASLEAKLTEHGSSLPDAERIYQRTTEAFNDRATAFSALKGLLDIADPECVAFQHRSVLWPGFDFDVVGNRDGVLRSARFKQAEPSAHTAESPAGAKIWSMDVSHFEQTFRPLTLRHQTSHFDKFLPAYEEYEFRWEGERYGARFVWGLFLSSSIFWE